MTRPGMGLTLGMMSVVIAATAARAQTVTEFYRGKTVNVLIGVAVGGEYDLQARLVARHIGKHIPGNPNVVAQNMTGAGGIKMANYLFAQAPRDGTYIGMLGNNFPATQAVGGQGVAYDSVKFRWLGSIAPVVETMAVWSTTGVKSIDDVRKREVVAGATSRGAITYSYPSMLNEYLGTKFKIVTGYAGGNEVNLAMERGEVEARNNSWSSWKATKGPWLADKKITVITQAGPRAPDLDAPSVEELARSSDERALIELVVSGTRLGRPMATTPDVPADRLAALRAAFEATMQDPDFIAEAGKLQMEIEPLNAAAIDQLLATAYATPKPIVQQAGALLEPAK